MNPMEPPVFSPLVLLTRLIPSGWLLPPLHCFHLRFGQWFVFDAESCQPSAAWLEKNDAARWQGSRDFEKAWAQKIKVSRRRMLAVRS